MADFNVTGLPAVLVVTVAVILFAAGMTKGVLGIGLPIIAVPLLSAVVPLPSAVALLAIPIVVTNLAQAVAGEPLLVVLRRLRPILLGMVAGVFIGVTLLTGLSPQTLKPLIGTVLILIAVLMLLSPKLVCPAGWERLLSPTVGFFGGILGGLAGQAGPLVFIYLLSQRITGDRFVQHSSMYLVIASIVLTLALGRAGAIGWAGAGLSLLCTLPILLGMRFGAGLRNKLPDALFRKMVLAVVILSGIDLCEPTFVTFFGLASP